MADSYFESSLTGQEIEDTLLGSVRGDVVQSKDANWQERARNNIGAASSDDLETGLDAKYTKPADGIPKTDLAEAVRASLGKADTALQQHQSLAAYRKAADQDAIDQAQDAEINKKADAADVYDKDAVNARDDALYAAILSGGGDYKATMRSFFLANGALLLTDLSELCDRWYNLSRIGWTGGVRFQLPEEGVTAPSDGERTGDNIGLSCTPSTTTEANRDDYASLPLFAVVDCNVTLDDDGKPHVTAIDGIPGSFQRNDPAKIVCCMQMTGWLKYVEGDEVYGWDYTDKAEAEGFYPLAEAVELADNSVRPWVVHCKYPFGDGWTCCSGVPTLVWSVSHNAQLTGVRNKWGNRYCGVTSADDAFMKLMFYIKYGQLDSDRVLHGCCNYNYTYQIAAAESGVERILITPAQAANLLVGSTICVGTGTGRIGTKANDTAVVDRKKITKIETVEIGGTQYGAVYVDNGGQTFNTATTNYMYTYQWWTGSTDDVLGNDGGIDPANDRYAVKLQGIEYMVGCYEVIGDTILKYGDNGGVNCCTPNICRDASKLTTSISANYKASFGCPTPASNSWTYPTRVKYDAALPGLIFPSAIGGSSTTGLRDGFYLLANTSGNYGWLRCGALYHGLTNAGLSCGTGSGGLAAADWYFGGRLSVTGNRGEYQAA